MSPPGDDERRPPEEETDARSRRAARRFDVPSVAASADDDEDVATSAGYLACKVAFDAHCIVEMEMTARSVLRSLNSQQLNDIRWIGLTTDGWQRVRDETDRRGGL